MKKISCNDTLKPDFNLYTQLYKLVCGLNYNFSVNISLFYCHLPSVGSVVGNILSLSLTGVICSSWWGWPASFYLFGALGLKWVLLWSFLGADRPGVHKGISEAERKYIESSLGQDIHKVGSLLIKANISILDLHMKQIHSPKQ